MYRTIHGLVNNCLQASCEGEGSSDSDNDGLYLTTFVAARLVQSAYVGLQNGKHLPKTILWGHGIMQSLAEAINVQKKTLRISAIQGNVTLLSALFFYCCRD